ncbi:MAG: hypothetical protein GY757_08080 [bacterium]|nr:hypothetical protein [bacterium]
MEIKKNLLCFMYLIIFAGLLLLSACATGSDGDDSTPEPPEEKTYALRITQTVLEDTTTAAAVDMAASSNLPFTRRLIPGNPFASHQLVRPEMIHFERFFKTSDAGIVLLESQRGLNRILYGDAGYTKTYSYNTNDHIYWRSAQRAYDNGTTTTESQTLNGSGYPTERVATNASGSTFTYNYTYDQALFKITTGSSFYETASTSKYKSFEFTNIFDSNGFYTSSVGKSYYPGGTLNYTYKSRYYIQGPYGFSEDEYYKMHYEDGALCYEKNVTFQDNVPSSGTIKYYLPHGVLYGEYSLTYNVSQSGGVISSVSVSGTFTDAAAAHPTGNYTTTYTLSYNDSGYLSQIICDDGGSEFDYTETILYSANPVNSGTNWIEYANSIQYASGSPMYSSAKRIEEWTETRQVIGYYLINSTSNAESLIQRYTHTSQKQEIPD